MGNFRPCELRADRGGITMRYKNTKTGAVIDSPCSISGGDWEVVKEQKKTNARPSQALRGDKSEE